jgi:Leucine-rich repeat (LRR) protein
MPTLQMTNIVAGLSNLRKSPDCMAHVYLNLALSDSDLSDITLLEGYSYLQNVNLRGNSLTDAKTLGKLLHLTKLDMSKNKLKEFLDFHPPRALREVDYSDNEIEGLGNIERHPYLRRVV